MLTEAQLESLRAELEQQRNRLVDSARRAMGFSMDRDRDRIGRDSLDESVEEWMYSTELRIKDREKYLLNKITEALQRIGSGEIDECEDCSEPIGYARLSVRPMTTMCIGCREEHEQQEGSGDRD